MDEKNDEKMSLFNKVCTEYNKPVVFLILFLIIVIIYLLTRKSESFKQKPKKEEYIDGPIRSDRQSDFNLDDQLKQFVKKQENYIRTLGVVY